jgi:hypothetical protein
MLRVLRLVKSYCGTGNAPTEPPAKVFKLFEFVEDARSAAPGSSLSDKYTAFAARSPSTGLSTARAPPSLSCQTVYPRCPRPPTMTQPS